MMVVKALASRKLNGRTIHVVEGERVERGDKVIVQTEDGCTRATIIRDGLFPIAVSRDGRDGG